MTLFNFDFNIQIPFRSVKPILFRYGKISSTETGWEFVFSETPDLVRVHFLWTLMKDHAGFEINLALFGYGIEFNIYDSRHYDYENHCWV